MAAAVCGQLRDDDAVYSGHRAHGHAIAKGAPLDRVMAELMGRVGGLCHGLGGSMHLVDAEHGLPGRHRRRRRQPPAGARQRARRASCAAPTRSTVVFFGDGAVQAGHFNESVNLAALWELPVIFVCENNGFAEFTPRVGAHARSSGQRRGRAVRVRARDRRRAATSPAVYDAFAGFLAAARAGRGPDAARVPDPPPARPLRGRPAALPRPRGRGASGAGATRSRGCSDAAIADGWLDPRRLDELEAEARAEVEAAVEFARASPFPRAAIAEQLVYAEA